MRPECVEVLRPCLFLPVAAMRVRCHVTEWGEGYGDKKSPENRLRRFLSGCVVTVSQKGRSSAASAGDEAYEVSSAMGGMSGIGGTGALSCLG